MINQTDTLPQASVQSNTVEIAFPFNWTTSDPRDGPESRKRGNLPNYISADEYLTTIPTLLLPLSPLMSHGRARVVANPLLKGDYFLLWIRQCPGHQVSDSTIVCAPGQTFELGYTGRESPSVGHSIPKLLPPYVVSPNKRDRLESRE
jgi:hypothetical protein